MTVRENVQLALWSQAGLTRSLWRRPRQGDAADALLAQVGIQEAAQRYCGELAYGDLKRVELAIALANAPRLLLMDEPTAGMAPRERIALIELTARLSRERNVAVLFTEHDMDVVFGYAHRVVVLDRGRLIAQGTPVEVRADANVRAVYLGSRAARVEEARA
jgi:branched-chain amino acid transport system ATP-binding protein